MDISIIIPLLNEEESLEELHNWIVQVMESHAYSYEILFMDDGSTDQSWDIIHRLSAANPAVKGVRFRRNYGKSAALNEGFILSQGNVIITMDADLQDNPEEIPGLYNMIMKDDFDIVSGWKKKRHDPISKTIPTKLYNWTTRRMTGIKLHDFNCGLKAYKSEVIKTLEIHGEMHRYIPVIAKWKGFTRIGEKIVQHHPRKYGSTKFGLERFINGFLDLTSILFVSRFGKRPMHFFGTMGTLSFVIGFIITFWLILKKIIASYSHNALNRDLVDIPLFYIALLMIVLGTQLFLAGFLGELVSRNNPEKRPYLISQSVNCKTEKK
jgi:glycosyltransferase involved in cell wall biosynthesis